MTAPRGEVVSMEAALRAACDEKELGALALLETVAADRRTIDRIYSDQLNFDQCLRDYVDIAE